MTKHVILDTDIGGDPDDAFALLFGLSSPKIQIDLIVTSDEHQGHRAEFARRILQELRIDIPVVKGSDLGNNKCCVVCDLVDATSNQSDYLSKIKEVVQRNPKTYYVCISPQTNLATFLEFAPELVSKLEVVIMGGAINYRKKDKAEHNVRYDVESARKVFYSDVNKRYVLSGTTSNPALEIDEHHPIYKKIMASNSPIKELLLRSFQNFFKKLYPSTFMHDPLTLSYVINPGFLTFEQRKIDLDSKGIMRFSKTGKLTTISTHAEYQRFTDFFSQRLPF